MSLLLIVIVLFLLMLLLPCSVLNLKTTLINHTHIPEVSQVLLINGGEPLDDRSRVAKYQSGTVIDRLKLFYKVARLRCV